MIVFCGCLPQCEISFGPLIVSLLEVVVTQFEMAEVEDDEVEVLVEAEDAVTVGKEAGEVTDTEETIFVEPTLTGDSATPGLTLFAATLGA